MTGVSTTRLVGIDLGTTNSAVAWIDARADAGAGRTHLFAIPQLVAAGEIGAHATLPSFLYLPTPGDLDAGGWALPWNARPDAVAGVHARDHGSLVPARLVASAKSWLSNRSVDRRAALLPWGQEAPARLSPVEASARLLAHLRDAWNHAEARDEAPLRLERQAIVLAVPASFDEEARELTVEAARAAGFDDLTLIEEPLAALYAWMAAHRGAGAEPIAAGRTVLVCDVGGGTTDFSLFQTTAGSEGVRFERTAIGEHLLLGGDNLDLALAAAIERRLATAPGAPPLTLVQRQALRRQCSAAKERLLAGGGPGEVPIAVLGSGRGLVAGTMATSLSRADVERALDDFLPTGDRHERPARERPGALRELGLPYESDPAITRHLAAFLARAARATARDEAAGPVRPDAVLFNGGFFTPPRARERILEALEVWFGGRPAVLSNDRPEAAVALGAAVFAGLRRDPEAARRLLVRAGSARTYYIGVREAEATAEAPGAVCVMPRGTQEGTQLALDRPFVATANQPAAFTLYSATDRADPIGTIVSTDDAGLYRHAPLVTALSYGKRSRRVPIPVGLAVRFTEVGTLEIWCESRTSEHRWRLQFHLRGADAHDLDEGPAQDGDRASTASQVLIDEEAVAEGERLVRGTFAAGAGPAPEALTGALEQALGHGKHAWPLPVVRRLADALLAAADGRRASAAHEARWLNLAGFCARPGFGTTLDPWRITGLRTIYAGDLVHPKQVQNQVEWLILWQRVAGGFTAAQQQELARKASGLLGLGARKGPHLNPQVAREAWRLLGSLERLDAAQRLRFGDEVLARVRRDPRNAALVWTLGRLGARVPAYGPLNAVVPADAAARWLTALLALKTCTPDIAAAAAQIGARTGDPARDIDASARAAAAARLDASGLPPDTWRPLRDIVTPDRLDAIQTFGETLPQGLAVNPA